MKLEELFENKEDGIKHTTSGSMAGIYYKGKHWKINDFKSEINRLKRGLKSLSSQQRDVIEKEINKMEDLYNNSDFIKKLKSLGGTNL